MNAEINTNGTLKLNSLPLKATTFIREFDDGRTPAPISFTATPLATDA